MTTERIKKASVIMQDEILLNAVKKAAEKIGFVVAQDVSSTWQADFVIFDTYFFQLGLGNILKKESPQLPLILITREGELSAKGLSPHIDFYDTLTVKDHNSSEMSRQITEWFSKNAGRPLIHKKTTKINYFNQGTIQKGHKGAF